MTTELVPKTITPQEVFVPNGLDSILNGVKSFLNKEILKPFDINNEKDREERKSFAYQISRSKTFVDDKGKTYVAELKAKPKIVDAERKRFRDLMDTYRDEAREPVTKWEIEEGARELKRREDEIIKLDWEEALQIDNLFSREREIERKEAAFAKIAEEARQKEEAARLAKEQAERDERLKKEAAEQAVIAEQAKAKKAQDDAANTRKKMLHDIGVELSVDECRAMLESTWTDYYDHSNIIYQKKQNEIFLEKLRVEKEQAEADKIEAAKQAEIDKQAAIELAIRQSEERARLEQISVNKKAADAKAVADKLSKNKKHQGHINNQIISAFYEHGWKETEARAIVTAVANGKIPFMSINYY